MGPFHMATRNRFGAFTCALKLVSKCFETGLTKPGAEQVSLYQFRRNRFRSAKNGGVRDAHGVKVIQHF